jgi:hypothetical protein
MALTSKRFLDKDDPIHQLAMALRSLVEQSRLSFVLAIRQHGELCKPREPSSSTAPFGAFEGREPS